MLSACAETSPLRPSPDTSGLTGLLVEAIKDLCDAEAAALLRLEPDGSLVFERAAGGAGERLYSLRLAPGEGVAGQVLLQRTPEVVYRPASDASARIRRETGFEPRCVLAVPLVDLDGTAVGVAEAVNPTVGERFGPSEVRRLMSIAQPLASALRSMRQLAEDEKAMARFYAAVVDVLYVRGERLKSVSETLEGSRRAFELARARQYSDEKLTGLARMAAGLAHEINNPLAVVRANLTLLGELFEEIGDALEAKEPSRVRAAVEEGREVAAEAGTELVRICDIVSRLMLFGDRPAGNVDEVSLAREVERVVDLARAGALRFDGKVPIELEIFGEPIVRACRGHVRQVVLELVDNAVRAAERSSHAAGGRVVVRVFSDATHAHLVVEDNGDGLPLTDGHERIFEPFYTTKPTWRSLGLGLTAAYGIVRGFGGILTLDSLPGRGTQVTVSFPRRAAEVVPLTAPRIPRSGRYYEDLR